MDSKVVVGCALCSGIAAETNKEMTIKELAKKEKLTELTLRSTKFGTQLGYLCKTCDKLVGDPAGIEKLGRTAGKYGNSAGVVLPSNWLGKEVLAVRLN